MPGTSYWIERNGGIGFRGIVDFTDATLLGVDYDDLLTDPFPGPLDGDAITTIVGNFDFTTATSVHFGPVNTNQIDEEDLGLGVTIETVPIKDGLVDGQDVSALGAASHTHDQSLDTTDNVAFNKVDTADIEPTGGVLNINNVIVINNDDISSVDNITCNQLQADTQVKTDVIVERIADAGVTADGVLMKDGSVTSQAEYTFTDGSLGRVRTPDKSVSGAANPNLLNMFAGANANVNAGSKGASAFLSAGNGNLGGNVQLEAGDGTAGAARVGGDVYFQTGGGDTAGKFQVRVGGSGGTDEIIVPAAGIVEDNGTNEAVYRNASGEFVWRTLDAAAATHDQSLDTTDDVDFANVTVVTCVTAPCYTSTIGLLLGPATNDTPASTGTNSMFLAAGDNSSVVAGSIAAGATYKAGDGLTGGISKLYGGTGTVTEGTSVGGDVEMSSGDGQATHGSLKLQIGKLDEIIIPPTGIVEDNATDEALYRNASDELVWRTIDAADSHSHNQALDTTDSPTFADVTVGTTDLLPITSSGAVTISQFGTTIGTPTLKVSKTGSIVTATFNDDFITTASTPGGAEEFGATSAWPAAYTPAGVWFFPITVQENSVRDFGYMRASGTTLQVWKEGGVAFGADPNNGCFLPSMTWSTV